MKLSKKRKVLINRLQYCTKNYFDVSSLHCIHYITDPKSSKFKSYFWAFILVTSTCLCFILINSQFRSYHSNRITTTISTTAFPVWEVPFPAVTLCNFNLVYKDNIEQFRKLLENKVSSEQIDNFFSNLSSLIVTSKASKDLDWEEFIPVTRILARAGYNTDKLMYKLVHPCEKLVTNCYWNMKQQNCSDLFHLSKTDRGYCCSFNYHGIRDDSKFQEKDKIYVSGVGSSFGLYVQLNTQEDQYISPLGHSFGIDVAIHENIEYPDMSIYSTTVHPGTDVSLSVKPEITESEENVRHVDIKTRGCAFAKEIKMAWTNTYSYNTCIHECKAKAIRELCKCVPFYYSVKERTRFCTLPDMACIKKNDDNFKGTKIAYRFHDPAISKKASGDTMSCRCYPQCNEISYPYQLDQQALKISESQPANDSILRVYFGHVSCTKLLRSVFITWELVLASVGGLIGLCLGGSILSVIEFFYHIFEAIFSRYTNKKSTHSEKKKYKPKLYLSDFGKVGNSELFKVSNQNRDLYKDN